jgi:predicted MPP superfamily phosphohydrolase
MKNTRNVIPLLFLISAILFLIDSYVFTGIKAATSLFSAIPAQLFRLVFWAFNAAFIVLVLYTFSGISRKGRGSIKVVGLIGAVLFIPQLVFALFLLGEDVFRLFRALGLLVYKLAGKDSSGNIQYVLSRSPVLSLLAGFMALIVLAGIIFGITKGKYRFKVHKTELEFDDLPEAFDGFTITQISDIHAGSFDNAEKVKEAIGLINEQGSDVILFTGDLVNEKASEMEPWVEIFNKLEAPMGKYSILGNHDYGDYSAWPSARAKQDNLESLFDMHERIGFHLIKNGNLTLSKNGGQIELLGMENWGSGFSKYGDFEKTLLGTSSDAFRILLSHDPSHWEGEVVDHAEHIHLTLAGHTHGMQFGLEFLGLKFSPASLRYSRWAGLYKENNRYLYVNRGFGFLGFPGRVGIWPEITVITLRKSGNKINSSK